MQLLQGRYLEYYRPAPESAKLRDSGFTGEMDYRPHVYGCKWLVHDVLPRPSERRGDVLFSIVDADPARTVLKLARRPGVTVTGYLQDTRDWLRHASISIAPLRIFREIQNKNVKAIVIRRSVVGTTSATPRVEGAPGRDYLAAETADEIATACAGLLERPEKAIELGAGKSSYFLKRKPFFGQSTR